MKQPEGDPPGPDEKALARALRFIDYRPRSRGETTERLIRWGYSRETSAAVVDYLERCGVIDDPKFARAYLGEMLRKDLGYYRVRRALVQKKLERGVVDEVMEEYPIDEELGRAERVAESLAPRLEGAEALSFNRRLVDCLVRRGYSRRIAVEACGLIADVDTPKWREYNGM